MDQAASEFEHCLEVRTEELDQPATIDAIARFVDPTWTERVEPVHLNRRSMFDYSRLTVEEAKEARRLFERFDFHRVLREPEYLLSWSLEKALEAAERPAELLLEVERELRRLRRELEVAGTRSGSN